MQLKNIKQICRRSHRDDLRQIRENLAAALLAGALKGTNALDALKEVDRELARRALAALFKE
ncbi:MAG TPA: hypothetical protein PLC99_25070 [Verrucomicrobiota bacterium]|jgi:predicted metal-dependent phosphoesterase TrpH|nr:hypothetical protein [Verrucomicrobiota bacterium]